MEWFLYRNGEQSGPMSADQLFKLGREGSLQAADLVWNAEMKEWTPVGAVSGLVGSAPEQPQVSQPPANSEKETIIQELLAYSDAGPFNIARGSDTDVLVTNEVTNSSWFSGNKKATYTAQLLLKEGEKTAYFWEMLKESSSGLSFQMGVQKKKIKGTEVFQQSRERGYAPGGVLVYDYEFDYGSMREAFKKLIESRGWKFKVAIMRGKTTY
jgi:hypothetical protein